MCRRCMHSSPLVPVTCGSTTDAPRSAQTERGDTADLAGGAPPHRDRGGKAGKCGTNRVCCRGNRWYNMWLVDIYLQVVRADLCSAPVLPTSLTAPIATAATAARALIIQPELIYTNDPELCSAVLHDQLSVRGMLTSPSCSIALQDEAGERITGRDGCCSCARVSVATALRSYTGSGQCQRSGGCAVKQRGVDCVRCRRRSACHPRRSSLSHADERNKMPEWRVNDRTRHGRFYVGLCASERLCPLCVVRRTD